MRIPIDECINQRLRDSLPGHECETARYAGLGGLKNGDLLTAAENARFDVLLTVDQGIEYEQNLSRRTIAVIILCAKSIRLKDLLPLMPACLTQLKSIQPGQIVKIEC
jgi:predicted nuclease of predicted toxin-antitoxin system